MFTMLWRQDFRIGSPRLLQGKQIFPVVEYLVCFCPGTAGVVAAGVVQPRGMAVVWEEGDQLKGGVLPVSGMLVPNEVAWDEMLAEALWRMDGSQG